MRIVFTQNGVVIGHGTSLLVSSGTDSEDFEVPDNSPVDVGWTVTVTAGAPEFSPPAAVPPIVSPIQFMLLFTPAERIAIKGVQATDAAIGDFMSLMNDPRLQQVDLALQSTQDGIEYALNKVAASMEPPYEATDISGRVAQILTGRAT